MCRSGGNHKLCISIRAAGQPALQPSITISPTTVPNFRGCCAVSTVVISPPANQADKLDLAEFVYRFGQQPDSWLATGPGRTAFWSEGRRGLVSYTVRGGFAMVGGGLICPPDEQQQLLLQFLSFCKSRKWRPVFFLYPGRPHHAVPKSGLVHQQGRRRYAAGHRRPRLHWSGVRVGSSPVQLLSSTLCYGSRSSAAGFHRN